MRDAPAPTVSREATPASTATSQPTGLTRVDSRGRKARLVRSASVHSESSLEAGDDDAERADGAERDEDEKLPNLQEAVTAHLLHLAKLGIMIQHAPRWPRLPPA